MERLRKKDANERKEEEERGDTQQESDQFVQPPVFGRFENTREQFHQGVFVITRNNLRAMLRVHQSPSIMQHRPLLKAQELVHRTDLVSPNL